MMQGAQVPPEVTWARGKLGLQQGQQPGPVAPTAQPAAQPTAAPRGAAGVFMHEALPSFVGTAGGFAAGARIPGPPIGKLIGGAAVGLTGDRLVRMAEGELTPEEQAAHPTALNMGRAVGAIGGYMARDKGFMSRGPVSAPQQPQSTPPAAQSMSNMTMPSMGNVPGVGAKPAMTGIPQQPPAPPATGQALTRMAHPVPPGARGRGMPQAAPSSQIGTPPSQRGRGMPAQSKAGGITPPGARGRGVPQAGPSGNVAYPPGTRGRDLGTPSIMDRIGEFFRLNGRMPTDVELQQLLQ